MESRKQCTVHQTGATPVLLLSVPYLNAVRRLATWWILRRNRRVQAAGGQFYQFAFSRTEARAFIERNGFRVLSATPYDPARLLRRSWGRLVGASRRAGGSSGEAMRGDDDPGGPGRSGVRRAVRRLLYTRAGLHAFGHMILFTAVKR